ncbi:MAG: RagB/SusD family nutrient uptake outer membrane protein [Bacteroidales bacterium]|nr:RagB/SusD family nutrient uptake outer membrane protein [Bacteroidales bacterium]
MKINKLFAVLALGAFVFSACNDKEFLEEKSYLNDSERFYESERAMEIGLAAAYANVQYMVFGNQRGGSEHNWIVNGMGLDSFTMTNANANFSNWSTLTADSGYARHWGDYMYKLANRANTVIDMIDEHPEIVYHNDTYKNELRAEGVFLRAYAYRILAGLFGSLVYSEHMTTGAQYDYEMISREEAWKKIAEDFKWAEENLPVKPRLTGTVTKAAAAHFLAETYLALGKFADAEKAATRVIDGTDGAYEIMKTRFGNRKTDAVDRYGNSLAAPQGAYWDLFRSSAKSDGTEANDSNPNDPDNKEAIWVAQIHYEPGIDSWPLGGSGDSWFRTHFPVLECTWAPWIPMGGKNGTRTQTWYDPSDSRADKEGNVTEKFYIFTADATCFPAGVNPAGSGTPATDIPEAQGRKLAYNLSTKTDSLALRATASNGGGIALGLYASEFVTRPYGDINGSYWDDPHDFRGSEIMIQRDYYTPSGKKWSEVKANIAARAALHANDKDKNGKAVKNNYSLTAADTINVTPRYWKFSDDHHPFASKNPSTLYNDTDWYLIRIAETYLLRAEARLAQGNKSGAAEDINVLRSRAGAADVAAAKVDIDYILDERVRELFGEEQRWITLSRLSCNPNATYVLDKYPTQNTTTSNTLYERTRKYGFGYENDDRGRESYTDAMGLTRHIPNIKPHNYVLPIPTQIIQSNKDKEIAQNAGY